MFLQILFIAFITVIVAVIINGIERYHKKNDTTTISFKEAMDLVELPIITFYNCNTKLNFLLDTGSNNSHINKKMLP